MRVDDIKIYKGRGHRICFSSLMILTMLLKVELHLVLKVEAVSFIMWSLLRTQANVIPILLPSAV